MLGLTTLGVFHTAIALVAYSSTILFHMIPAVTESSTRLPRGAPLFASQDAPVLQVINLVLLVAFLIGAVWQVRWLRRSPQPGAPIVAPGPLSSRPGAHVAR